MRRFLLALLLGVAIVSPVNADFTGKDASLATITFKNASGACTAVVCVPQAAITDSTGSNVVAVTTTAADAQSNVANGLLTYSRNVVFNGTTWDRWTGAVTITGTPPLPTGAATSALQTTANTTLSTIATNTSAPIPAQSVGVPTGGVGICDGANGATNPCTTAATVKAASTPPVAADKALVVSISPNSTAADPCTFSAKTNVPISTGAGTTALVTGVSAKKIYVCSLTLIAAAAVSVSLSEGSSATCGTSAQAGVIGVATSGTAANGMSLAANGGMTFGSGGGTVAATATAANYLCLFQSGTVQIAGNLTYVQQ